MEKTMGNQCESMKPSISVIIPFYNGEKYWAELVDSLRVQTSRLDEAVIVLDGDEQRLPEINIDEIARQVKIIKLCQNKGVANARNIGIDAVKSDYIFFLDQDDYFYHTRVEEVRKCIEKENPYWVVNNYKMVSKNGDLIKIRKPRRWLQSSSKQKRLENHFMQKNGGPNICAVCCKKSIIKKFPTNMGTCDDFVFIFDLLDVGTPCVLDVCGNARRYHDSNYSQNIAHRQSQIKSVSSMQKKYNFSGAVRRRSMSNLCCNLAIESMVYHDVDRAIRNFYRAYRLNHLNYKALLGLILCKISTDPVKVLNRIKAVLNVLNLSKSTRIVGS